MSTTLDNLKEAFAGESQAFQKDTAVAKTAEAVDGEGWMHTGDLAVMDENGYCNIVGRIKDMVIRGGENVYPREP